jgi:hypothetical protein
VSKRKKILLAVLGTPVLLILAAGCVIRIIYLRDARRAEALLNDVRSLRVGESSASDVQGVVEKYGGFEYPGGSADPGCPAPDNSYHAGVTHVLLNRFALRFPALWFVIRPRGVGAEFLLKSGRLCYLSYGVDTFPAPHQWLLTVSGSMIPVGSGEFPSGYNLPYRTLEATGNHNILNAQATSDAPLEDRRKVFAFDLSCLSRFGGCRSACELLPSAWLDWQTQGHASPEQLNEPWCERSAQSH